MEELMKEERLYFSPRDGQFDVDQVCEKVESLGFPFRDPVDSSMIVICPDEESRLTFLAERTDNPSGGYPMVLLVQVRPDRVYVNQFAGPEFFDYSRDFIGWLIGNYACRVTNDSDRDLTEQLSNPA